MTVETLRTLFESAALPAGLVWAADRVRDAPLFPDEAQAMARAVPARRAEFAAGRAVARAALSRLGVPPVSLPPDARRIPVWPEGTVGSISHAAGLCVAIVGRRGDWLGLGIDIESDGPLEEALVDEICRPEEIDGLDAETARLRARRLFSAKEAIYKAQSPSTGVLFGFHGLSVSLESGAGRFAGVPELDALSAAWRSARLPLMQSCAGGLILSVCAIPA